jgi:hypothetical protein
LTSNVTEVHDLLVSCTVLDGVAGFAILLESHFLRTPAMRKDRVRLIWEVWIFSKFETGGIEQSHV